MALYRHSVCRDLLYGSASPLDLWKTGDGGDVSVPDGTSAKQSAASAGASPFDSPGGVLCQQAGRASKCQCHDGAGSDRGSLFFVCLWSAVRASKETACPTGDSAESAEPVYWQVGKSPAGAETVPPRSEQSGSRHIWGTGRIRDGSGT